MTVYYHGTNARFLYPILSGGFKLGETRHGRVSGNGLYVATKPETAAHWADNAYVHRGSYAFKCSLKPGTRILWKEPDYNKKIIRHLEKEFSKKISQNYDFWKYIPHNKQLTGEELRALASHLDYQGMMSWSKKRERFDDTRYKHLSRFSRLIRQYGYDALGDRTGSSWDSDEIVVYNPSKVIPLSAHRLDVVWSRDIWEPVSVEYSAPLSLEEAKVISEAEEADWQRFLQEGLDQAAERDADENGG